VAGEPILVVDDNPAQLRLLSAVLEAAGHPVRLAPDADEAVAILKSFRPRLILMDIQLPGIDGLTLTRMIKANPSLRDILIVGVTAYAMAEDEDRVRAAGCDGYLSKPYDTRALPNVIASYLHPTVGH
jgi:two-component system, cell cycle response regulator DivK